jgi:alpha-tubulin suppressor-like RCC1 family protein
MFKLIKKSLMLALALVLIACGSNDKNNDKNKDTPSLTGFDNSRYSHLTATAYTVCAQTKSGILKCWGDGDSHNFANGKSGYIGDESADSADGGFPASQLGDQPLQYAMANVNNGCALYTDGVLKCWGSKNGVGLNDLSQDDSNYVGDKAEELGNNLPVINLGEGLTVRQVSVGDSHICAVMSNGRLKCWGDGSDGRLGYGDTERRGDSNDEMGDNLPFVDLGSDDSGAHYTVKQVYAGYDRTCAILNNDQIKCWGSNSRGEAGYGDFNNRGDEPGEMGNHLPFVDLGTGRSARKVFAYYVHTCAILDNGGLKCWGSNRDGEIGLATGDDVVGNNVPHSQRLLCDQNNEPVLYQIADLAAGEAGCTYGGKQVRHSRDSNGDGQMSDGEPVSVFQRCNTHDLNHVVHVSALAAAPDNGCSGNAGYVVSSDYDDDGDGEIGDGTVNRMGDALPEIDFGTSAAVVDVTQGDDHTCALLADATLKCWGDNGEAQLGLDSQLDTYGNDANEIPAAQGEVDLGDGVYAVAIAGSYSFNCALLNTDEIKCWGYDNDYATLGVPEYLDEYIGDGDPEPEMGNALQLVPVFAQPQAQ